MMKITRSQKLTLLIRMLREFDTEKNTKEQTKYFLNYIAYELELILGGNYE